MGGGIGDGIGVGGGGEIGGWERGDGYLWQVCRKRVCQQAVCGRPEEHAWLGFVPSVISSFLRTRHKQMN